MFYIKIFIFFQNIKPNLFVNQNCPIYLSQRSGMGELAHKKVEKWFINLLKDVKDRIERVRDNPISW